MTIVLDSTIKVSLVVLTGLAAAVLLRGRSASVRHWILTVAIGCAAALPLLETFVPVWQLGGAPVLVTLPVERSASAVPGPSPVRAEMTADVTPTSSAPVGSPIDVGRVLQLLWAAGMALSLVVLSVGVARLAWLSSRAHPLEHDMWTAIADEVASGYGLRRPVRLLQADHPSLLVAWGLAAPKVMLPRGAEHWDADRIRIVLRHELAHIRRGDCIVQIAGELLRSAYWFNPIVWIACASLRQESEQACDDEVLASGIEGCEYATHLLALARELKTDIPRFLPAPAIARPSRFERRIRAMLDTDMIRKPATRSLRLFTVAALVTMTVAIAAAQTGSTTLTGRVLDSTGAPVPGATVLLTNPRTQAKFEVTTDSAGQFEFVPLPSDDYTLEARFPAFQTTRERIRLAAQHIRRDLTLPLGTLEETVSVRGGQEVLMIDGRIVTPGSTLDFKKLQLELPTSASAAENVQITGNRDAFERAVRQCPVSTVGGRVRPPRKIKDVRPAYPASLQGTGVAGKVVMKLTIATDGTVREVEVRESAHPELAAAAVDAARQWLFDGTLLNCVPVEVTMTLIVAFGSR
jgi:TonB family protein